MMSIVGIWVVSNHTSSQTDTCADTSAANIPGKPREPLNYAAGIPTYLKTIRGAVENGFEGFTLQ